MTFGRRLIAHAGLTRAALRSTWLETAMQVRFCQCLKGHTTNARESEYVAKEEISVCTLDDSVMPTLKSDEELWLKVDTQGYESEVFKGARRLIPHVIALECELTLVPLYEGQVLIDELLAMIYGMGFMMVGIAPVFCELGTGSLLQIDGTFVRA